MLDRKELFKNTLKKAAHAFKRINELRLTGESFVICVVYIWFPSLLFPSKGGNLLSITMSVYHTSL